MFEHFSFDRVQTPGEAYQRFLEEGVSIAGWAIEKGFNPALVYSILHGKRKCIRGQSHKIALCLGIKTRESSNTIEPNGKPTRSYRALSRSTGSNETLGFAEPEPQRRPAATPANQPGSC